MLDTVEAQLGPIDAVAPADLAPLLELDYAPAWAVLSLAPAEFQVAPGARANYQSGGVLLSSDWHQNPPYNDQCPNMSCSWPDYNYFNQNAVVGCVATAGSQIMRYWNWPPYGDVAPYADAYDWPNMLDRYIWCSAHLRFEDALNFPISAAQIDAVAELCHEVGVAVSMAYGCGGSSAYTVDMEGVFENHFRYSTACTVRYRSSYSAVDWFARVKAQCNSNRAMQYNIPGHSIVVDGWREVYLGGVFTRQYHINYGWGLLGGCQGCDTWYTLDAILNGNPSDEFMLENIVPAPALGATLAGTYARPTFPYRYVDQDATGTDATFAEGQGIQFLPNVTVTCTGGSGIRFRGSNSAWSGLYTRGRLDIGVNLRGPSGSCLKLASGGQILFR
jgi:hypothetical protein